MAPWNRNRPGKASEKDLKRKANAQDIENGAAKLPAISAEDDTADDIQGSSGENGRTRASVVSMSAVDDSTTIPQSSTLLEIPCSPGPSRNKRFSLMRFGHASDSQLSKTAKEHADGLSIPGPFTTPSIIATAPTLDSTTSSRRRSTLLFSRRNKEGNTKTLSATDINQGNGNGEFRGTLNDTASSSMLGLYSPPPPYGDRSASSLALPVNRASESDASSGEQGVFATTTTTHTVLTTTTFFKLPRRKKNKGPLFPLPPKPASASASLGGTPRISTAEPGAEFPGRHYFEDQPRNSNDAESPRRPRIPGLGSTNRSNSRASHGSPRASSQLPRGSGLELRGRSSTMNSASRRGFIDEDWVVPAPHLPQSTRTSTSTAGRPSLAGFLNLSRMRHSSEPLGRNPHGTPATTASMDSKMESSSPPVIIPERQEGDTAAKYLSRLEEVVHRSALVAIASKTNDEFMKSILRSFMRRFSFFEDPLDMAVRKLLMHINLPRETQQIDRTLQAFADRYHECNPGVFPTTDHAYFCAFSIVILHTDAFNKNNKHKMQRADYVKNAKEESGVSLEVMECFYDNIIYTPFIHLEDDVKIPKQQAPGQKTPKKTLKAPTTPLKKQSSGPIDPYMLILDGSLDSLRPDLGEILSIEDPFNCTGTVSKINVAELNRTFLKYGVLQVLSSRSRPGAFLTAATTSNPAEAQVGVVDMRVTKVGTLWRKDPKKKKTRSPWQEWGAVLTPSQLYLFRNTSWTKSLVHQYEVHTKLFKSGSAVVFKPPLEQFAPDFALSMDEVVALVDSEYKKHKHSFFFTRSTSFQEVFLADTESELNDWVARINFAATYRTAGVRMRAVIGSESQVQSQRSIEIGPPSSEMVDQEAMTASTRFRNDAELTRQVMEARTQIIEAKLKDAVERREALEKSIQALLRLARQVSVLTPIQTKTRQSIIEGTIRLAANTRWSRIDYWRTLCHHDILKADLDLDNAVEEDTTAVSNNDSMTQSNKEEKGRLGFSKLGSRLGAGAGSNAGVNGLRQRPSNQLSGRQMFSMDDIFRSPSRTRQPQHRSKGSWELPPLAFDRGRSLSSGRISKRSSRRSSEIATDPNMIEQSDSKPGSSNRRDIQHADDDHEALVAAGIVSADTSTVDTTVKTQAEEEEKAKVPELEEQGTITKARHSYQAKLPKVHIPTPLRSKKHRDSVNSSTVSDDSVSVDGPEGLARGPGKFTVHGKKASVVTFGSTWSELSPEERMRSRRPDHGDETSPTNETVVGTSAEVKENVWPSRPSSSHSTVRDDSKEFVTPTEEYFSADDSAPSTKASRDENIQAHDQKTSTSTGAGVGSEVS